MDVCVIVATETSATAMALSLHQSWEAAGHPHPGVGLLHDSQSEVADALLGFFSDPPDAAHLPIDSLLDPPGDCFLHDDGMANPLPCFSAPSAVSLPPGLHAPGDDFDLLHRPKRPRSCSDLYRPSDLMFEASSCNVAGCPAPELMAELLVAAPPPARGIPAFDGERKSGAGCLSAQSVAARARRKRISEKTQELGRLIPGGNKMNTAEMFQAAYNYVKFLQAQVGILGLMGSIKVRKTQLFWTLSRDLGQVSRLTVLALCRDGRHRNRWSRSFKLYSHLQPSKRSCPARDGASCRRRWSVPCPWTETLNRTRQSQGTSIDSSSRVDNWTGIQRISSLR